MREWSVEDLTRWGNELRDNELSFVSQCEMVSYAHDMFSAYTNVISQLEESQKRIATIARPLIEIVGLASVSNTLPPEQTIKRLKYWATEIQESLGLGTWSFSEMAPHRGI